MFTQNCRLQWVFLQGKHTQNYNHRLLIQGKTDLNLTSCICSHSIFHKNISVATLFEERPWLEGRALALHSKAPKINAWHLQLQNNQPGQARSLTLQQVHVLTTAGVSSESFSNCKWQELPFSQTPQIQQCFLNHIFLLVSFKCCYFSLWHHIHSNIIYSKTHSKAVFSKQRGKQLLIMCLNRTSFYLIGDICLLILGSRTYNSMSFKGQISYL